jgi:flavin reductase (DIM6/NTAB) family NADH-FMN oxidoreductase RutF
MQRTGAATRRFYAAFYQLTVRSANPTRRCVAGTSLTCRRANSTTTGKSKRSEAIRPGSQRILYPQKAFPKSSWLLEQAPVQSTAERPFGSLEAWDHVVRDRSLNSVTLEISVPRWVLRTLDLTQTAKINEVQVRLPDNKDGDGDFDLRPVLLSGDPVDVRAVWRALHDAGAREAPRQPIWSRSKLNKIPNEVPRPPPPIWRFTFNEPAEGPCDAYFCIPESAWQRLAEAGCVQWFQQDYGVQTDDLGVYNTCTYLRLTGEPPSIFRATKFLQQANRWTSSQAVERYEFIRDCVNSGPDPNRGLRNESLAKDGGLETRKPIRLANGKWQSAANMLPRSDKRVRLRRFAVPEPLQRQFEDPDSDLLAKIQKQTGLEALRYRPMAGSRYYLQVLGNDAALGHALPVLEELLCPIEDDGSRVPLGIDQHQIMEYDFRPADATHFAWIKVPGSFDMDAIKSQIRRKVRDSDCLAQKFRAGGKEDLMLRGTEEAVELCIAIIQERIDDHRAKNDMPAAKLKVHKLGPIQDISKMTPWEDFMAESDGKAEGSQTPPISASEDARQKDTRIYSMTDKKASGPRVQPWEDFSSDGGSVRKVESSQVQPKSASKGSRQEEAQVHWMSGSKAADSQMMPLEDMPERLNLAFTDVTPKEIGISSRKAADPQVQTEPASKDIKQEETKTSAASASTVTNSRAKDAAASNDINNEAFEQGKQSHNERLGDYLRSALRHLTQPVALVTSTMPVKSVEDVDQAGPRGVTVSSFCTVSLAPEPIISFNLRVPSRTWDAIEASKSLNISLLAASPEGAAVAHAFTLPYEQPFEPFKQLETLGASVNPRPGRGNPRDIAWDKAIYARINANLLPKICVRVGDHMVVFARVKYVRQDESSTHARDGALAYGMRGYRSLGDGIKPMEMEPVAPRVEDIEPVKEEPVKVEPVKVEPVEEKPPKTKPVKKSPTWKEGRAAPPEVGPDNPVETKQPKTKPPKTKLAKEQSESVVETDGQELSQAQSQDLWKAFMDGYVEDLEKDDPNPAETQGSSAPADLTTNEEGQASKDLKDVGPSSPIMDEESLRQVLGETEASYSSKGLPSQTANENPMLAEALKAAAGAYDETPVAETKSPITSTSQNPDTTTESSSDATQNKTPSNHSKHVKNGPWGMNTKNKKPSNRTFSTWNRSQTRSYSTSNDPKSPTSDKISKSTVEDFLCQIPTNNRLYNNLIAAQRQAEKLEKLVSNGKVAADEIAEVEAESQAIRRRVARELAWRNAQDLRVLLDQGHISPERAQWLETNLEQGQAILLKEAKLLREELEEEKLLKEEFEGGKAALMKDYEEFEGLLKRLREFVDEDDVGAQGGGQQEAGSSGAGRP